MTTSSQRLKTTQTSSILNSSDHHPTVVLCSSRDENLLSQDICSLCGSIGKGDEGNLICCSQCGQCYHPFCVNIKGLKVVISKGWRCLECTVCETCGKPGDEAKLMLCDECEISYHTYCLDPPLEDVPQGAWKCHWCVVCQDCKKRFPGINSSWQKNYTKCGPCSSRTICPICKVDYKEGDLVINCMNCERWLHGRCDSIRNEEECELASEFGYNCLQCRPKDEIPLYMLHRETIESNDPIMDVDRDILNVQQNNRGDSQVNLKNHDNAKSLIKNQELESLILGPLIKTRESSDFSRPQSAPLTTSQELLLRRHDSNIKRPSSSLHFNGQDSKYDYMIDGLNKRCEGSNDINPNNNDDSLLNDESSENDILQKCRIVDGIYLSEIGAEFMKSQKLEPAKRQRSKRGSKLQKLDEDDANRDDEEENKFTVDDKDEEGRKKRVRKLGKLGIGGFSVRQRGVRVNKDDDLNHQMTNGHEKQQSICNQSGPTPIDGSNENLDVSLSPIKTKRVRKRAKKKTNLTDQYPAYIQEAFFGKDLLTISTDSKRSQDSLLNDCPISDLHNEDNSLLGSINVNRQAKKLKTSNNNIGLNDSGNEFLDYSTESAKTNDYKQSSTKDINQLPDVFIDDSRGSDGTKRDHLDPDLLSTDFNIEMDSKEVEDLLNGLSGQSTTSNQKSSSQMPQANEAQLFDQQLQAPRSANSSLNSSSLSSHQYMPPQPAIEQVNNQVQQNHVQSQSASNSIMSPHTPIQHIPNQHQPQQHKLLPQQQSQMPMISTNISPHQHIQPRTPVHGHGQNQGAQHSPLITPYDINDQQPIQHHQQQQHMSHQQPPTIMNNNAESNSMMINRSNTINSPSLTLSPRAKMSSPCIVQGPHRPGSNASSIGQPMVSPAQQQQQHQQPMHHAQNHTHQHSHNHPLAHHHQQHPPGMSPHIAPNDQYQVPQSPMTTAQSQMAADRQFSPQIINDPNWQQAPGSVQSDGSKNSNKSNNTQNWEQEEMLGEKATKSAVLFANLEHPELRQQFVSADERFKQIQKLWRQLPSEKRKPFVDKARENRSASKVTSKSTTEHPPSLPPSAMRQPPPNVGPQSTVMAPGHSHMKMGPHDPIAHSSSMQPQQSPQMSHSSHQMSPAPPMHHQQHQDGRWRQPGPMDQHPRQQYIQVPQQNRHVLGHESPLVAPPSSISPASRVMNHEPHMGHYEQHPPQQMPPGPIIGPGSNQQQQNPSAGPMFRPPTLQPGMQVARVRPPTLDRSDPYAMPPSTPRPVPQRTSFSPQTPYAGGNHTPPVATRTPTGPDNNQQAIYQQQQLSQASPITVNQSHPNFVEQSSSQQHSHPQFQHQQPHHPQGAPTQQPQQPQTMQPQQRHTGPQYIAQRLGSPMNQAGQYSSSPAVGLSGQAPVIRGFPPNSQQIRPGQSYQPQHPMQHNSPGPQRAQSPMMVRPMIGQQQQPMQAQSQQRMMQAQPRMQGPMQHPHQVPQQQLHQAQAQLSPHIVHQQQPVAMPQQPQQITQQHSQLQPVGQTQLQNQNVPFANIQASRIDPDDAIQLLEDDDDLKDLGADFNILEYADPEPDKGASTSTGKNAIEIDPELEEYFDDRDTLTDKQPVDQMLGMTPQPIAQQPIIQQQNQQHGPPQMQIQQQPHQMNPHQQQQIYNANPNQQPQNVAMNQGRGFVQEPHVQHQQPNVMPQQSAQRPPQFINQQQAARPHMVAPNQPANHQGHHPQQVQMIRGPGPQIRMQSPAGPMGQQHSNHYQQTQGPIQRQPQLNQRYVAQQASHQLPMETSGHQPHVQQHQQPMQQQAQMMGQQRMNIVQQPQQRPNLMQSNSQQHYQHQQQQHQPQQSQHHQANYGDVQHQHQGHVQNHVHHQQQPQQQQQYVQHQSQQAQSHHQQQPQMVVYNNNQQQQMQQRQYQPQQPNQHYNYQQQQQQQPNNFSNMQMKQPTEIMTPNEANPIVGDTLTSFEFTMYESGSGAQNEAVNFPASSQPAPVASPPEQQPERSSSSGANQPQNQLLKQLLGNCSSADNPPPSTSAASSAASAIQESVDSPGLPLINVINTPKPPVVPPSVSGIPNISFHMDVPSAKPKPQQPTPTVVVPSLDFSTTTSSSAATSSIAVAPVVAPIVEPVKLATAPIITAAPISVSVARPIEQQQQQQQQLSPVVRPVISHVVQVVPVAPQPAPSVKVAPTKPPKDDYIAKRRALLEKEKTPPPKESKPAKKRTRGPNKRTKIQTDPKSSDDASNQNASSDTSQQALDGLTSASNTPGPGPTPRKRVRKNNQNSANNGKAASSSFKMMEASENNNRDGFKLADKIHLELPNLPLKEPEFRVDNNVCSIFACGDLNSPNSTQLRGKFGQAEPLPSAMLDVWPKRLDRNGIKQIGFYHDEFPIELNAGQNGSSSQYKHLGLYQHLLLEQNDHLSLDRDCDSPCSIVSNSTTSDRNLDQEQLFSEISEHTKNGSNGTIYTPNIDKFIANLNGRHNDNNDPMYKPTDDNVDGGNNKDFNNNGRPKTPTIPLEISLPVRHISSEALQELCRNETLAKTTQANLMPSSSSPKTIGSDTLSRDESDKENQVDCNKLDTPNEQPNDLSRENDDKESPFGQTATMLNMRFKEHGNVSVTLTLTNKESDGVKRVLNSLSQLIDYPIASSCVMSNSSSTTNNNNTHDERLSNSFRLLTSSSASLLSLQKPAIEQQLQVKAGNQLDQPKLELKDLKFNELAYNNTGHHGSGLLTTATPTTTITKMNISAPKQAQDVKPEVCCRCSAIVVDCGIRKPVKDIPDAILAAMRRLSFTRDVTTESSCSELVFCSVGCYGSTIVSCKELNNNVNDDLVNNIELPSMMDCDDETKSLTLSENSKPSQAQILASLEAAKRHKKWRQIRYKRWTASIEQLQQQQQQQLIDSSSAAETNSAQLSCLEMGQDVGLAEAPDSHSMASLNDSSMDTGDDTSDDADLCLAQVASSAARQPIAATNNSTAINSANQQAISEWATSPATSTSINSEIPLATNNQNNTANNNKNKSRFLSAEQQIQAWPEGLELIQMRPIKRQKTTSWSYSSDATSTKQPDATETAGNESKRENNKNKNDEADEGEQIVPLADKRKCVLCHELGDGDSDGPARLLNLFVDAWVHLNCALWSLDVYELGNGALMNVELACRKAMICSRCRRPGATLKCFKPRCPNYYHFLCAVREECSFYEDKSLQCRQHSKSAVKEMTSFVVKRRVYVNRDEQKQIAEMIQECGSQIAATPSATTNLQSDSNDQTSHNQIAHDHHQNVMRIGSLVFLQIGQLLPHQLAQFHDRQCIFPVGYEAIRYYWSYRRYNKRCKYLCSIRDRSGRPEFRIVAREFELDDENFAGDSPQAAWAPIIGAIVRMRSQYPDTITTFPAYIKGQDLFGLSEPSVVRILESLPGVETLTDYEFKFGRSPLFELPLAINPSGCARTEPKLRTHIKRLYTIQSANCVPKSRAQSSGLSSGAAALTSNVQLALEGNFNSQSPYIKQFVHSKSSQYRKMKSEWRNNVVLARSSVQGLGLYAARDIEKHTMVIEYIGMLIRNEIAEKYEKIHEAHNRGIYMFRLDEDRVIDATLAGGLARYINHSCNPNCVAEAVEIDRERKILIITSRKILKGEELAYDYKLNIEDDQHKISCLCGAPTCKKFMN